MSHSILDRFTGIEELELGAAVEEQVEAIAEEAVRAEIAEATVEMQDQGEGVQELVERLEDLEEDVEELEETVEGLESLLASGNFNGGAFAHMFNKANKLSARLGGESVDVRMGAEALGDAATAQVAARDGMEKFSDTVKDYAKTAIAFIKNIFNAVINFFVGLVNKSAALTRRQAQLVVRVKALDEVAKDKKVKLGSWAVWFDYAKDGLSAKAPKHDLVGKLGALSAVAEKVDGMNVSAFSSAYSAVVSEIKTVAGSGAKKETKGDVTKLTGVVGSGILVQASFVEGTPADAAACAKAAGALKLYIGKAGRKDSKVGDTVDAKVNKVGLNAALSAAKTQIDALPKPATLKGLGASARDSVVGTLNSLKGDKDNRDNVKALRATISAAAACSKSISTADAACVEALLNGVAAHL